MARGPGRRRHGRLGPPLFCVKQSREHSNQGRCPTCRAPPNPGRGPKATGEVASQGPGTVRAKATRPSLAPPRPVQRLESCDSPRLMLVSVSSDIDGVGREAAQQCTLSPAARSLARFTAMPCTALLHVTLAGVHAPHARMPQSQTRPSTHARAQDGEPVRMPTPPGDHERVRARDRADTRAWRGRGAQRVRDSRRGNRSLGCAREKQAMTMPQWPAIVIPARPSLSLRVAERHRRPAVHDSRHAQDDKAQQKRGRDRLRPRLHPVPPLTRNPRKTRCCELDALRGQNASGAAPVLLARGLKSSWCNCSLIFDASRTVPRMQR